MPSTIVSVSQGAELVRKDRQTLYNHRKLGKLSFVRREDDSYGVDTAELERVYGKLYVNTNDLNDSKPLPTATTEINSLRHQLELRDRDLKQSQMEVKHRDERLADAEQSIDEWRKRCEEAKVSQKLLEGKVSDQNAKEVGWKNAIADREQEIKLARNETDQIRKREEDQAKAWAEDRRRLATLKSRGFWARLLNKQAETI